MHVRLWIIKGKYMHLHKEERPDQGHNTHSLAHVEGEAEVLLLGEEQDEEVVARLALLDGRVQADLGSGA